MFDARKLAALFLTAVALGCFTSCGREAAPPRSRDEIFRERLELPSVYLTVKSHKQVSAPGGKGSFVDNETGELCWPALCCNNPDCPGRTSEGPYLFIDPDPGIYLKADKTVGYDKAAALAAPRTDGTCPRCATKRNVTAESGEVRQRYLNWVRPYVLPETIDRMKALDEELQRRIAYERMLRKIPDPDAKNPVSSGGPQPTMADPAKRPKT